MEEDKNLQVTWGGFTEAFLSCENHEDEAGKISSLKKLNTLAGCKTLEGIREILDTITEKEQNYLNSPLLDEILDTAKNVQVSPIIQCATKNKINALKFYLKRGDYSEDLQHALCRASVHGHTEIIKILLRIPSAVKKDEYFLKWSAAGGHTETVRLFLGYFEYSTEEKNIALMYALRNEHLDTIKLLLESGADPHSLSTENREEFPHYFSEEPEYLIVNSPMTSSNAEIVELFMQHGLSPFDNENAAINHASIRGNTEVIKLFLENKYFPVDINIDNGKILNNAIYYTHVELVEFLLKNGADTTRVDLCVFVCYDRKNGEKILDLLLSHGANAHQCDDALVIVCKDGHKCAYAEVLLKHGANVRARDNLPLKHAFMRGKLDLVKLLLEYGADINNLDDGVKNSYFYQAFSGTSK